MCEIDDKESSINLGDIESIGRSGPWENKMRIGDDGCIFFIAYGIYQIGLIYDFELIHLISWLIIKIKWI